MQFSTLFSASLLLLSGAVAHPNALFARTGCTLSTGETGTCISTSSCTGKSTPGYCPGAASIQCCTGYGTCALSDGTSGSCQKTSSCSGTSTPGHCPGPSDIQCCTSNASPPSSGGSLPMLNSVQSAHARVIAQQVHAKGMPVRGCEVAIATAMQESSIRILANSGVAESLSYPHDGVGSDHDSVGIFQQRPSWGSVKDRMDAAKSAGFFLTALARVSGWQAMSIAKAAQTVQVSAYPDAYAKWETLATNVCQAAF